jgi:hypothetical protein
VSLSEVVMEGTLKPDGTLELDRKPKLSPGRVTVVLRQETDSPQMEEDWFQFLQNARKKMDQAGCHFMDEKEIQAHIDWLREGDRIDDLLPETGKHLGKLEQP